MPKFPAAGNLILLGMFAELVVRTGDYRETEPILTRIETSPQEAG